MPRVKYVTPSPRERQVLDLVIEGCSNKEILAELGISESMVKLHLHRCLRKLGAKNRSHAAALWAVMRARERAHEYSQPGGIEAGTSTKNSTTELPA